MASDQGITAVSPYIQLILHVVDMSWETIHPKLPT